MKTVERLRKDADSIWKKIIQHPFVVELYRGDLSLEKFKFYILQDYHYLITAIKNFGIIVSKAPTVKAMREVADILQLEAQSEFDGYKEFLKQIGHTVRDAAEVKPMSVSLSYSSFLVSTSSLNSYPEAITAVLPCFWSYAEIAEVHKDKLSSNKNHLYKDWANAYLTESYLRLVEKIKDLVNEAGKDSPYPKLKEVFVNASRYEYLFWDAVYHRKEWLNS
ncbi:MAG: thiaminase II [Candidatus Aminicenantes bacterium]